MPTRPPTTAVNPSQREAGTSGRVCPVSGVRPYTQTTPVSCQPGVREVAAADLAS